MSPRNLGIQIVWIGLPGRRPLTSETMTTVDMDGRERCSEMWIAYQFMYMFMICWIVYIVFSYTYAYICTYIYIYLYTYIHGIGDKSVTYGQLLSMRFRSIFLWGSTLLLEKTVQILGWTVAFLEVAMVWKCANTKCVIWTQDRMCWRFACFALLSWLKDIFHDKKNDAVAGIIQL